MKNINLLLVLFAISILTFTSCTKEEVEPECVSSIESLIKDGEYTVIESGLFVEFVNQQGVLTAELLNSEIPEMSKIIIDSGANILKVDGSSHDVNYESRKMDIFYHENSGNYSTIPESWFCYTGYSTYSIPMIHNRQSQGDSDSENGGEEELYYFKISPELKEGKSTGRFTVTFKYGESPTSGSNLGLFSLESGEIVEEISDEYRQYDWCYQYVIIME